MLKISLTTTGLLDKATLEAWTRQKQAAIHKAVAIGMRDGGKVVADGPTMDILNDEALMLAHGLERPHILRHSHPH